MTGITDELYLGLAMGTTLAITLHNMQVLRSLIFCMLNQRLVINTNTLSFFGPLLNRPTNQVRSKTLRLNVDASDFEKYNEHQSNQSDE